MGLLVAPLAFDFVRSYYAKLDELDWSELNGIFEQMERVGTDLLVGSGAGPGEITPHPDRRHPLRRPGPPDKRPDSGRDPVVGTSPGHSRRVRPGLQDPSTGGKDRRWSWKPSPGGWSAGGPRPAPVESGPEDRSGGAEAARKGERPAYFPSPRRVHRNARLRPLPAGSGYCAEGAGHHRGARVHRRHRTGRTGGGGRTAQHRGGGGREGGGDDRRAAAGSGADRSAVEQGCCRWSTSSRSPFSAPPSAPSCVKPRIWPAAYSTPTAG